MCGQCSLQMQARAKSEATYETMQETNDSLALIATIKGIAYKFESQKNLYLTLDSAKAAYYSYRQGKEETDSEFASNFGNIVKVIEHFSGQIHEDKATLLEELKTIADDEDITIDQATDDQINMANIIRKRKCHGMGMLRRADKDRYGQLIIDLENQHTFGTDNYPGSMTETYTLITKYKKPRTQAPRHRPGGNGGTTSTPNDQQQGMTFVQRNEPPIEEIQCYNCQGMGRYARRCTNPYVRRAAPEPPPTPTGVQLLQDTIIDMDVAAKEDEDKMTILISRSHKTQRRYTE